ncbi:MAG TPA: PxKF domain-containing protein [Candidatus Angelobacter sp.]|nr:PxKF domain-containing protein [Candidatus Angelobacter sp.]
MKMKSLPLRLALCLVFLFSFLLVDPPAHVKASANGIVISQIYGGGGNAGSTFKNDFIEIFNADGATVNLNGWSVQYASAAGTTWQVTALSGSLAPGQYFLIQESQGAGGTTNLPTPNATGNIAMSATAGKVALVSSTVALSGGCPVGGAIVDFVGYGTGTGGATCFEGTAAAPTLTNTTADFRRNNGLQDTDSNTADFVTGAPNPRNTPAGTTNPSGAGAANPASIIQGGTTLLTVLVTPGANPTSTGIVVTGNLSSIGGSATEPFFDDGTNGDVTAGNNTFSFSTVVTITTTPGTKSLPISISDAQGRSGSATITLVVTTAPLNLSIHDIQGSGDVSPFAGRLISTTGIVTGVKSNGFFIQNPDSATDADPNTSEGVFVFTSSRPTATATVGNMVQVVGTVSEFIPSSDPNSPPSTEISGSPTISLISTGNPLPTPVTLTVTDTNPAGPIDQLEKYEGMRVHVDVLNVVGPTDGNVNEANATSTSNGIFFGVLPGVARPFREPGVQQPDPLPAGAPANVPRFDSNPELICVDSDALGGAAIDVTSGATVTSLTGPLDFSARFYTIDVDPGSGAAATGNVSATPVPVPALNELTIANFNMERFFDTVNDPATSDVALTATAFANRLNKASLAIRTVLNTPDVIGVEEMENLSTLQTLADKVNADAVAAGQPSPNYQAFLVEGNDVGGIDVGLLVKSTINVISVEQVGKSATFIQPDGATALLNDRPPLVLTATASQPNSDTSLPFTMVVNHLRSLLSIDDPVDGPRVRAKRAAQAEFLANLLQSHQAAGENVISVCDCNAFEFSDGYVDVLGTILGRPAPVDQVVTASPDLVDPDFTDLVSTLPHDQQYSYVFNGNAQVLDHVVVNPALLSKLSRFAYARNDADFPEVFRNDPNRPERISDHDMPVAYFTLPEATPPVLHLPADITAEATSPAGATVNFTATATDARDTNVLVTCVPPSGSQFALGATTVNCSATNSRNKTAEGSFTITVADTTPPVVVLNGVTNGATYTLGAVPAASCSTTDSATGVAVQASLTITGGTANGVGHFTATCSGAKDGAGNIAAPVSASYDVDYLFNGFFSPVSSNKIFKLGSTVPLKWTLQNAQQTFISAFSSITAVQVAPDPSCLAGDEGVPFDAGSAGNSGLQFQDNTFQFNWKTTGLAAGCYAAMVSLDDGTRKTVFVTLR